MFKFSNHYLRTSLMTTVKQAPTLWSFSFLTTSWKTPNAGMSVTVEYVSLRMPQRAHRTSIPFILTALYMCSWGTLAVVDINTCSRRQNLHKTRMTTASADSENIDRVNSAGSLLVRGGSKTTVHCMKTALQKRHLPECAEEEATNLLSFLKTKTTQTFVNL